MSRVRSGDTKPELAVRRFLHVRGFRYRLHVNELPGRPDLVLPKHETVVFVHGCFWHCHQDCEKGRRRPQTRQDFWNAKLDANIQRDRTAVEALREAGWNVIVVWECEAARPSKLRRTLKPLLERHETYCS
jgi:DNA mismatch endonuclease (patch repair protein)